MFIVVEGTLKYINVRNKIKIKIEEVAVKRREV